MAVKNAKLKDGSTMDVRGFLLVGLSVILALITVIVKGWDSYLWVLLACFLAGWGHIFLSAHHSILEDRKREEQARGRVR